MTKSRLQEFESILYTVTQDPERCRRDDCRQECSRHFRLLVDGDVEVTPHELSLYESPISRAIMGCGYGAVKIIKNEANDE